MVDAAADSGRRVRLKDVAVRVGVTTSTVSKVVNDKRDVGPEVRQRVLQTIEAMGYRPNSVARRLRMQRSDMIAIITDDLEGIFTNAMMRGVEDAASTAEMAVLLCNSYGDPAREKQQLRRLLDHQVDALIFMSGNRVGPRPYPAMAIPNSTPFVYLYEYGEADIPAILPDDKGGARLAVEHLAGTGAHRIAFVNGPPEWEATQDRLQGYMAGLGTAKLPFDDELVVSSPSWKPEDAYAVMRRLLQNVPDIDSVFSGSDDIATGVIAALDDCGMSIPRDVQVVGFDDRSLAVHQRPPLTTIALPLTEMGRLAGELVLGAITSGLITPGIVRLPCRLVQRESTRAFGK